jgi:hypothetical protein
MGTAQPSDAPEVAYCGLVCGPVCCHALEGCVGCGAGGGAEGCEKRECCRERQIEGCWQCADFPCGKGFYGDEAWRGLNVGCVQMVKEMGRERFGRFVLERLKKGFDYGYLRYQTPDGIRAILSGDVDIPREDPDIARGRGE